MPIEAGHQLLHYRLIEKIGEGGMGAVWKATDTTLDRDVAIKVLPTGVNSDRLRRFKLEARSVAAVNHPNIVTVYSVHEIAGVHFIAMELVRGHTLTELISENGFDLPSMRSRMLELCEAVAAAHDRGIIHRDLKPANVMVGEDGRIKVLDFGLAKIVSRPDASPTDLTQTSTQAGVILGTLSYMSPEQARGEPTDQRTDVFSLGVVLYVMATGHHPFKGNSVADLMSAILRDPAQPACSLRPELPGEFDALIDRCLEKKADQRFDSAREVWKALAETIWPGTHAGTTAPPRLPTPSAQRTPYVGREAERAELNRLLDGLDEGHGALMLIAGEPGVGKTRLVLEALWQAYDRGFVQIAGHCEDGEEVAPFIPFVEVLEQLVRSLPQNALRTILGDSAPEVARLVPELRRHLPDIPDSVELPPEQQRRYLFNSVTDSLRRMSEQTPTVLLLDDLHWGDESSLLLLEHLSTKLSETGLLVIGTYRDVDLEVGKPFARVLERLVRRRLAHRIALKRLPEETVGELLSTLGGPDPPAALVSAVYRETEGNPFFVEEVFRHLSEEDRLFESCGEWKNIPDVGEMAVPEGVKLVIGRRLDRLNKRTLKTLTAAAVVGRRFELRLLESLTDLDEDTFLDGVEEIESARLVVPVKGHHTSYQFTHALIRQTLLESLSLPRRQRLHLRVAEAMDRLHGDRAAAHAADLAHHYYQAGAAADPHTTVRYLLLAGDHAMGEAAPGEAVKFFETALSLDEDLEPTSQAELLYKRGLAHRAQGAWEQIADDWSTALTLYEQAGDTGRFAQLCEAFGHLLMYQNRTREAAEVAERGLAIESEAPGSDRCRLLASAGTYRSLSGDPQVGDEMLLRAIAMADEIGDPVLRASTALRRLVQQHSLMRGDGMMLAGERAIELARAAGARWELSNSLGLTLMAAILSGNLDRLPDMITEAEPLAEELGDSGTLACVGIARQYFQVTQGELERAVETANETLDLLRRAAVFVHHGHCELASMLLYSGRWEQALEHSAESMRLEADDQWRGWCVGIHLRVLTFVGHTREASELIERCPVFLPPVGSIPTIGQWAWMFARIEALATLGRGDEAAGWFDRVREAIGHGTVWAFDHGLLTRLAGIAAACGGCFDEAESCFNEALRQSDELPVRFERPETLRWYAWMLAARNEPGDHLRADGLLDEAVAAYDALGMHRHTKMIETNRQS